MPKGSGPIPSPRLVCVMTIQRSCELFQSDERVRKKSFWH